MLVSLNDIKIFVKSFTRTFLNDILALEKLLRIKKFQSSLNTNFSSSDVIEKQGFKPLFKYLNEYNLPKIPTMLSQPDTTEIKFDWVKSIVKLKRSLGVDKLIGFDVFPDPKNRSVKFLAIGSPSQENDLPL